MHKKNKLKYLPQEQAIGPQSSYLLANMLCDPGFMRYDSIEEEELHLEPRSYEKQCLASEGYEGFTVRCIAASQRDMNEAFLWPLLEMILHESNDPVNMFMMSSMDMKGNESRSGLVYDGHHFYYFDMKAAHMHVSDDLLTLFDHMHTMSSIDQIIRKKDYMMDTPMSVHPLTYLIPTI